VHIYVRRGYSCTPSSVLRWGLGAIVLRDTASVTAMPLASATLHPETHNGATSGEPSDDCGPIAATRSESTAACAMPDGHRSCSAHALVSNTCDSRAHTIPATIAMCITGNVGYPVLLYWYGVEEMGDKGVQGNHGGRTRTTIQPKVEFTVVARRRAFASYVQAPDSGSVRSSTSA
jgi:hypothetical protein